MMRSAIQALGLVLLIACAIILATALTPRHGAECVTVGRSIVLGCH